MNKLSKKVLKDRKEQAKIRLAIAEAIPEGVLIENVIKSLIQSLTWAVYKEFEEDENINLGDGVGFQVLP